MSIPDSLTIPSPILPPVTISLLQSIEQSFLCCNWSLTVIHIKYSSV